MIFGFKRTRRVDLGVFVAPEAPVPGPVERVVDEGMLIADSAVRMAVKNHIIVGVLRDGVAFDTSQVALEAKHEFVTLADRNAASARQVWRDGEWDDEPQDDSDVARHRAIFLGLEAALREAAEDDERISALVTAARDNALAEVVGTMAPRSYSARNDNDYDTERAERMRLLVAVDLADLEAESSEY